MLKEIKEKWVEALRSGKYKQGREVLKRRDDGSMCCLGVLCEVAKLGRWIEPADQFSIGTGFEFDDDHLIMYGDIPNSTLTTLEMTAEETAALIDLNDVDKKSFAEIADYIEANL